MENNKDMAVKIAKDVIEQLDKKKIIAANEGYIKFPLNTFQLIKEYGISFQKIIQQNSFYCKTCAIGSLFVSYVNLYNNFNLDTNDLVESHLFPPFKIIDEIFGEENVLAMEYAFEKGEQGRLYESLEEGYEGFDPDWINDLIVYCDSLTPEASIRKIMNNIIKNNGEFNIYKD